MKGLDCWQGWSGHGPGRKLALSTSGNASSSRLPPVPASFSLKKRSMPRALSSPAERRHLNLHPSAAVKAVTGRLQLQLFPAAKVKVRRRDLAVVVGLAAVPAKAAAGIWIFGTCAGRCSCNHSDFWSSLMGMFNSTNRLRSAVAGRPRVVR